MNRLHLTFVFTLLSSVFPSLGQVTLKIDASNSPYNITNDLTINLSDSLIIGPGAEIYLEEDVDIRVYGAISIRGTKEAPVLMQGSNPTLGWGQIIVNEEVDTLIVEHATIDNGRFLVFDTEVRFSHVRFLNRQELEWNDAIARFFYGSLFVDRCEIIASNKGEGFLCHNIDTPILIQNYFESIPDAVELLNCFDGRIGKSIFRNNSDDAIDLNNCINTVVDSNIISGVRDRGMEIGSEGNGSSSEIWVHHNLLFDCKRGINFKEGSSGVLENNTLHRNDVGISVLSTGNPTANSFVNVVNCIFSENEIPLVTEGGSMAIFSYCSSTEWLFPGEGNFIDDPVFENPEANDFRLGLYSPCIDRGWPLSPEDPDGTRCDMGVYYQPERFTVEGYQNAVKVWPNPVQNDLSIHMLDAFDRIALYDSSGKKQIEMDTQESTFLRISLSHLSDGVYTLHFYSEQKSATLKILKQ